MDKYEKALIEQAMTNQKPHAGDDLWKLLIERRNTLNQSFEFSANNIEKLNSINQWLKGIESKAVDHARRLVAFLKAQQIEGHDFLIDYELDYEVQLWAPNKFVHLEPLANNPFFTLRLTLPNFKKYVHCDGNLFEWEIDDDLDSMNWFINENHNEFENATQHPLCHQRHCWLFHELYDHTYLAWEDLIDIEEIWMEVVSRQQHISTSPLTKYTK